MVSNTDNPRFVLGLKIRRLRKQQGLTLKNVADRTGIAVSYLSEIEKGKKYPKPEKLMVLAEALGVSFDELVSLQVSEDLAFLKSALASPFLRDFPFKLFGFDLEDVFGLVSDEPKRAGALVHALVDVTESFDLDHESFLLAALRAYQQLHHNHFPELEEAATEFRGEIQIEPGQPASPDVLAEVLTDRFGYQLDWDALAADPKLSSFRSVFQPRSHPTLFVNSNLLSSQQAFVLAREIGYATLGLKERALTSSWLKIESFDQVHNNFQASYFAGAVLLDAVTVTSDIAGLFASSKWRPNHLHRAMERFETTPETYFTRLTQIVPKAFDLERFYFARLSNAADGSAAMTKLLNTSALPLTRGLGLGEHHCRRWPSFQMLAAASSIARPKLLVQHNNFVEQDLRFLALSAIRPLALDASRQSSVTIAWQLDEATHNTIRFAEDPSISSIEVGLTCERCPLSDDLCDQRAAPASRVQAIEERERREIALAGLAPQG